MTSFLIDDFIADHAAFGATTVILSSASAKTAFGAAFLLHRRGDQSVVGLTSSGNRAFVESLGCYDVVLTYDELDQLPPGKALYIDIAGNSDLRRSVHQHYGDELRYSCAVGYSHLGTLRHGDALPGPPPQFFFAPDRIDKRARDWADSGGVMAHHASAWQQFLPLAQRVQRSVEHRGAAAIEAAYQTMLEGSANPRDGHMLYWQD